MPAVPQPATSADLAVERVVHLGRGRLVVRLGVERVGELLGDDGVVEFVGELVGAVDSAAHPVFGGRVHHVGSERAHERLFFDAEPLGDDEHRADAELSGRDGEADAGVAGGRLDDGAALGEFAGFEHPFEHVLPDAVFDARARIERFELRVDGHFVGRRVDPDERRLPDGVEHRVEGFAVRGHTRAKVAPDPERFHPVVPPSSEVGAWVGRAESVEHSRLSGTPRRG